MICILLANANDILNKAAIAHNKSINLNQNVEPRPVKKPKAVRHSEYLLNEVMKRARTGDSLSQQFLKEAKQKHRTVVRHERF